MEIAKCKEEDQIIKEAEELENLRYYKTVIIIEK